VKVGEIDGEGGESWNGILETRSKLEDQQMAVIALLRLDASSVSLSPTPKEPLRMEA
jgi:hypothetical protein